MLDPNKALENIRAGYVEALNRISREILAVGKEMNMHISEDESKGLAVAAITALLSSGNKSLLS